MAHANCDMGSRDYWHCCWRLSVHDCGTVWTNFVRLVHCPRRRNDRADRLVFLGYTWLYLCSDRLCGWRSHRSFVDGFICSRGAPVIWWLPLQFAIIFGLVFFVSLLVPGFWAVLNWAEERFRKLEGRIE